MFATSQTFCRISARRALTTVVEISHHRRTTLWRSDIDRAWRSREAGGIPEHVCRIPKEYVMYAIAAENPLSTKDRMRELVEHLMTVEDEHVVTITMPLDRRQPNSDADRIGLRNLVADAKEQVVERCSPDIAVSINRRLFESAAGVRLDRGAHGVVIVVTAERALAHLLPFPVEAASTVAAAPATRLLVQGLQRSPRYRLLVVSDRATRLFEGVRDDVEEILDHGFPFSADVVPRDLRAVAGRFARAPGRDDTEQWRNFYRMVDRALADESRDDPLPIVLAGVATSTTMFTRASRNAELIVGRIDGAQEHASAHELGEAAWPIVQEHLEARRRAAIADLTEKFHAGWAEIGIADVWTAARQGRGRLLVVEENYQAEPSRVVDSLLVRARDAGSDVVDPVDEIIEHVVKSGGTVEFVAPDAISRLGHIGLLVR